jgi:hypothetical protein
MSDQFLRKIHVSEKDGAEWRLVVSTFRDVEYIHLRKYYMDMDGEMQPTKDGAAIPLSIENSFYLFLALAELLSVRECSASVDDIAEILDRYEQANNTRLSKDRLRALLQRESDNPG